MKGTDRRTLQHLEAEARQLRAEYTHDLVVRAVLSFDLAIRRLVCRLAPRCGACA
jgi:hypothetical protein